MASSEASDREFELGRKDFEWVRDYVYKVAGITLADNKIDLVYGRLSRRLRALKLTSFGDYKKLVESKQGAHEVENLINAITTNVTSFFRESHHFDRLRDELVPQWTASGQRRVRIWSAACSSGEEPYSISMSLHEAIGDQIGRWDVKILATDLDTQMVEKAAQGVYASSRVQGLSPERRKRWFSPQPGSDSVRIRPEAQSLLTFKRLNLMEGWPMRGPFDAIFCRNVMIYFDRPTQDRLIDRMSALLRVGGYLFIGHSEAVSPNCSTLRLLGRTCYVRV